MIDVTQQAIIPYTRLKQILTPHSHKNLMKWLEGQTTVSEGIFEWDFIRWVLKQEVTD